MGYTKTVKKRVEISKEQARALITDARHFPKVVGWASYDEEIVAYETVDGMNHRLFAIRDLPSDVIKMTEDELLEFVRDNMPDDIVFS